MFWPIFWILVMIGLLTAFVVAARREKKARDKAMKDFKPQPLEEESFDEGAEEMPADEFGAGEDEVAELDENAFK